MTRKLRRPLPRQEFVAQYWELLNRLTSAAVVCVARDTREMRNDTRVVCDALNECAAYVRGNRAATAPYTWDDLRLNLARACRELAEYLDPEESEGLHAE